MLHHGFQFLIIFPSFRSQSLSWSLRRHDLGKKIEKQVKQSFKELLFSFGVQLDQVYQLCSVFLQSRTAFLDVENEAAAATAFSLPARLPFALT